VTLHRSLEELQAGLSEIAASPTDAGTVELVVRRPSEGEREVLDEGVLAPNQGLVGDDWRNRNDRRGRPSDPASQVTLMNARAIALIAGGRERWPLAGDQLYVELDLSAENLPPGTRLEIGSALVEVTDLPHTGCAKFTERFGSAAIRFVNRPPGRELRLRGMYVKVVEPGTVRPGDAIRKLGSVAEAAAVGEDHRRTGG
jgi:MOSC domain-containing protein YiiM